MSNSPYCLTQAAASTSSLHGAGNIDPMVWGRQTPRSSVVDLVASATLRQAEGRPSPPGRSYTTPAPAAATSFPSTSYPPNSFPAWFEVPPVPPMPSTISICPLAASVEGSPTSGSAVSPEMFPLSPLGTSTALSETSTSPAQTRPPVTRSLTAFTGDPWPETPPLRFGASRGAAGMQRKLPPSMTESLEALVEMGVKTRHASLSLTPREGIESLTAVPEDDAPPRPPRAPLRSALSSMSLGSRSTKSNKSLASTTHPRPPVPEAVARLPLPMHRRATSNPKNEASGGNDIVVVSRPFGLPRSPSAPVVHMRARASTASGMSAPPLQPPIPALPMRRHDSMSSAGSEELIITPPSSACGGSPPTSVAMQRSDAPGSPTSPKKGTGKRPRRITVSKHFDDFMPNRLPDVGALMRAADMEVFAENGVAVRFGDLVGGIGSRTVVVFVRYWLESFSAQYIRALMKHFRPGKAGGHARVVIIGHGSIDMIPGYRSHFHCPFPVYTDPTRVLQDTLGILPTALGQTPRGDYVVHNAVVRAAEMLQLAARLHGFNSGDREQLGGEFVFAGTLQVVYAHRMRGTSDHASVNDLVAATIAPTTAPGPGTPCVATGSGALRVSLTAAAAAKSATNPHVLGNTVEEEEEEGDLSAAEVHDIEIQDGFPFPLPPTSAPVSPTVAVTTKEAAMYAKQRKAMMLRRPSKPRVPFVEGLDTENGEDMAANYGRQQAMSPTSYNSFISSSPASPTSPLSPFGGARALPLHLRPNRPEALTQHGKLVY